MTVDLESRTVKAGDGPDAIEDSFDIDDYTRWRLLEGLDDIGITLSHEDDIAAYEAAARPGNRPPSTDLDAVEFHRWARPNVFQQLKRHAHVAIVVALSLFPSVRRE